MEWIGGGDWRGGGQVWTLMAEEMWCDKNLPCDGYHVLLSGKTWRKYTFLTRKVSEHSTEACILE